MTNEKTTWTKEELMQEIQNSVKRDRMISFMTAAINWGTATGMSPAILQEGREILAAIVNPAAAPVQPPGEKGSEE